MQQIDGLAQLADNFDGFLFDIWGVIHDGSACFPAAITCLEQLNSAGIPYMFLSNMPRRAAVVAQALQKLGMPADLTTHALTSGEAVRLALTGALGDGYNFGRKYYFQGPARTKDMIAGLDLVEVAQPGDADFILVSGIGDFDTPEDYRDLVSTGLAKNLPMLCANPDLRVGHGAKLVACAGLLAEAYEAKGGRVHWLGKPHRAVFDLAAQQMGAQRILMVGDSLRTDIAGAKNAGLKTLFVSGGIHQGELGDDPAKLDALCKAYGVFPDYTVPTLRW